MAVYITAPLGVEIAEDRPEFLGMNARVEVGDRPAADSAELIERLITNGLEHDLSSLSRKDQYLQPNLTQTTEPTLLIGIIDLFYIIPAHK